MFASEQFNLRISPKERELLAELAQYFHRNQSDTIRVLVHEAHKALNLSPQAHAELPAEVVAALKDGRLKVADLSADTLGLGDLNQYDLTAFAEGQPIPK